MSCLKIHDKLCITVGRKHSFHIVSDKKGGRMEITMKNELLQQTHILDLAKKTLHIFKQNPSHPNLRNNLRDAVSASTRSMYECPSDPTLPVNFETDDIPYILSQLEHWVLLQEMELAYRRQLSNKIDYDFHVFMQHISHSSENTLFQESMQWLEALRECSTNIYDLLIARYNLFSDFWGAIDLDNHVYDLISDRIHQLKIHYDDFIWLYEELADYRSKQVLYGILRCWFTFDILGKNKLKENNFPDYYDFDLVSCSEDEVFVDLGAFIGDSTQSFIDSFGRYKRIYCYEITPSSMQQMQENLKDYDNIIYRPAGVGREHTTMYLSCPDNADSANRLNASDGLAIPVVTLDEDIHEKVTFIKMDIEGSELDALMGAKRHITEEHPKLAICTYHNNHHIWEVPRLMKAYNPDYKLYMRYNGGIDSLLISEFVTFAL